jgi:hypothetical protein
MVCCNQEVLDSIDNFYKLKNKYEKKIKNDKDKIASNDLLTKKEKRIEYNKIKRKCIKCGKVGGSIFLIINDNNVRKFIAKCNAVEKCKLDIEIILGSYERMDNIVNMLEDYGDNIKWNIIKIKLDLLFNYITEETAIEQFNENRKELDETIEMNRKILTDLLMVTNNYIKEQNIYQNNMEIYNNIKLLKQHIKQYQENGNIEHIKEALQIYQSRIIPISIRNQNMKYSNISIENHQMNDNVFVLKQDKYKVSEIEISINNVKDEIVKNNY